MIYFIKNSLLLIEIHFYTNYIYIYFKSCIVNLLLKLKLFAVFLKDCSILLLIKKLLLNILIFFETILVPIIGNFIGPSLSKFLFFTFSFL